MAYLADIRAGIVRQIKAAIPEVQCTGYLLENPTPPCIEIELGSTGVVFDRTMARGLDEWTFTIRAFAGTSLDEQGQKLLDDLLSTSGTRSLKKALEQADPATGQRTLGGSVSDCQVERVGQIRTYSPIASPTVKFYGVEWTLQVVAPGNN